MRGRCVPKPGLNNRSAAMAMCFFVTVAESHEGASTLLNDTASATDDLDRVGDVARHRWVRFVLAIQINAAGSGEFLTQDTSYAAPVNASVGARVAFAWIRLCQTFRGNSGTFTFSPSPTNLCSIQGLLNQCMAVTGQRYVMAPEVAAGTVAFGHTNALPGTQWVAQFEAALQTGQPAWWDKKQRKMINENLTLVRRPADKTVLVLRAGDAAEWRK